MAGLMRRKNFPSGGVEVDRRAGAGAGGQMPGQFTDGLAVDEGSIEVMDGVVFEAAGPRKLFGRIPKQRMESRLMSTAEHQERAMETSIKGNGSSRGAGHAECTVGILLLTKAMASPAPSNVLTDPVGTVFGWLSGSSVLRPDPSTGRLIDSYQGTRTKPMRVLCLGMSRTGTMSLFEALRRLGYTPYHMAVAMGNPRTNLNLWSEALNAKYHGQGKKWGKEEFDKILGGYDGVADVPCICFVQELVEAYPDAKVVLQTRDVDGWLKSMANTAGRMLKWKSWDWLAPWDKALAGPFWAYAKVIMPIHFRTMSDFSSPDTPARKAFNDHYDLVRRTVPKDRLLEYKVQEGWQPLCDFLEVPAPEEEFPRVNDAPAFIRVHRIMWWLALGKVVVQVALIGAVPVAAAWWLYRM